MKTYSMKLDEIAKDWLIVDAEDVVLVISREMVSSRGMYFYPLTTGQLRMQRSCCRFLKNMDIGRIFL